jgi:hypothetical protein
LFSENEQSRRAKVVRLELESSVLACASALVAGCVFSQAPVIKMTDEAASFPATIRFRLGAG